MVIAPSCADSPQNASHVVGTLVVAGPVVSTSGMSGAALTDISEVTPFSAAVMVLEYAARRYSMPT
jgi:hypothetical protein